MKQLIQKGVAFHHSGLIPILKEIIEIIFKKGLIKILFATETFAVGVNMPTRTVVFTNLSKNTNRGRRFLNTAEYKQMSGRAGRRGMDTKGTVILMTMYEFPDLLDLKSVMIKSMPHITSKFTIDYAYCLKTLNAINTNPESLFKSSLLADEINKDITYDQEKLLDLETQYNTQYNVFNTKYDNTILNNCKILYDKENTQNLGFNVMITMTPKQKKEIDKLKKSISQDIYNDYINLKDLEKNINIYKNKLDDVKKYIDIETHKIYEILINNKFMLSNINNKLLTVKGIIASMVNDCNNIILAELIAQNIFTNLNTKQIISLISIFANLSKSDNDDEFSHYKSNILNKEYENIMNIVSHYNNQEKESRIYIDSEYWNITNRYIDITMDWVNIPYDSPTFMQERAYVLVKLSEMGEYEGNFVKNMLKIYNIICNIKVICNILKQYELLQKLEDADKLILKDIVNVNSLYL
jgi:superfamily II RNA helicase